MLCESSLGESGIAKGEMDEASASETRGGGNCSVKPLDRKSGRRRGRGVVGGRALSSRPRALLDDSLNSGDGASVLLEVRLFDGGSEKLLPDLDDVLPDVEAGRRRGSSMAGWENGGMGGWANDGWLVVAVVSRCAHVRTWTARGLQYPCEGCHANARL